MELHEYSDEEITNEITRRCIRIHIDSVEVSLFIGEYEIGNTIAK